MSGFKKSFREAQLDRSSFEAEIVSAEKLDNKSLMDYLLITVKEKGRIYVFKFNFHTSFSFYSMKHVSLNKPRSNQ